MVKKQRLLCQMLWFNGLTNHMKYVFFFSFFWIPWCFFPFQKTNIKTGDFGVNVQKRAEPDLHQRLRACRSTCHSHSRPLDDTPHRIEPNAEKCQMLANHEQIQTIYWVMCFIDGNVLFVLNQIHLEHALCFFTKSRFLQSPSLGLICPAKA